MQSDDSIQRIRRRRNVVTIDDVARHAGVSMMTVSRVINDEKYVRDDMREVVLAAVRELNYAPNPAARSLASARGARIAVIYSNSSHGYMSDFLQGVLNDTAGRGVQLQLVKSEVGDEQSERRIVVELLEGAISGVILPPPLSGSKVLRDALKAAGVATVCVAAGRFHNDCSCVRVNNRSAAFDMTNHLLALGHRRIGFIKGDPNQTASAERLAGFRAALRITPGGSAVLAQGNFTFASGLLAAEQLLVARGCPTAIFASNDDMAAAAVSVAQRRGLDVPGDISVVGFGDTSIAITLWPPLTTVRQPVKAMAAAAIDLLIRQISARENEENIALVDQVFGHALVERKSSGPRRSATKPSGILRH